MMILETGMSLYVCDLDEVSLYPSIMRALNSSRMTLRFVPFEIVGKRREAIQNYFSNLVHVRENAVILCAEFHGLPNYTKMLDLVKARIGQN